MRTFADKLSRRRVMKISGAALVGLPFARLGAHAEGKRNLSGERREIAAGTTKHDTLSRQLARFVVNTNFGDVPESIVEAWKTIVLDSLAIGFVGSQDPVGGGGGPARREPGG